MQCRWMSLSGQSERIVIPLIFRMKSPRKNPWIIWTLKINEPRPFEVSGNNSRTDVESQPSQRPERGRRRAGWVPVKKFFAAPPTPCKDRGVKIYIYKYIYIYIYTHTTKSERMTLICKVTRAWSEKFNLYSWQIMLLWRNVNWHMQYSRVPGLFPELRTTVICTGFPPTPPVSSALYLNPQRHRC
jgi:hypothetical protein